MRAEELASPAAATSTQSAETYHVAVCEQHSNRILIDPVNKAWSPEQRVWGWSPPVAIDERGNNTWVDLTDIKFRDTSAFGWVALVTAAQGKVGIVNMPNDDPAGALLWSARPYGNPHAIERIPNIGAIVTASTMGTYRPDISYPGFLTV
jgi:hypothetical protein